MSSTAAHDGHPGLADLDTHRANLDRDGYTIVHDAFDTEVAAALHADVLRLERERAIGRQRRRRGDAAGVGGGAAAGGRGRRHR